jgi:hypothetical protein
MFLLQLSRKISEGESLLVDYISFATSVHMVPHISRYSHVEVNDFVKTSRRQ